MDVFLLLLFLSVCHYIFFLLQQLSLVPQCLCLICIFGQPLANPSLYVAPSAQLFEIVALVDEFKVFIASTISHCNSFICVMKREPENLFELCSDVDLDRII